MKFYSNVSIFKVNLVYRSIKTKFKEFVQANGIANSYYFAFGRFLGNCGYNPTAGAINQVY